MKARTIISSSLLGIVGGLAIAVVWFNADTIGLSSWFKKKPLPPVARRPAISKETLAQMDAMRPTKPLREFVGHTDGITSLDFSPDGKWIASSSMDQTVRIWNTATAQEVQRLQGHLNGVFSVAFSHDGHQVISAGRDMTTLVWDWQKAQIVAKLDSTEFYPLHAAFAGDDRWALVTAGPEVIVWDIAQEKPLRRLTADSDIGNLAVSPDGRLALTATKNCQIALWDIATGKLLAIRMRAKIVIRLPSGPSGSIVEHEANNTIFGIGFQNDHSIVIADENALWLWDRRHGDHVAFLRSCPSANTVISRDGALLARTTGALAVELIASDSTEATVHSDQCLCAAFSDEFVAAGGGRGYWGGEWQHSDSAKIQIFKLDDLRSRMEILRARPHPRPTTQFDRHQDEVPLPPWTESDGS